MKGIVIVSTSLLFFSCGALQRTYTHYTGELTYKCSKHGVLYIQSDSGLAPAYDINGKLVECKDSSANMPAAPKPSWAK